MSVETTEKTKQPAVERGAGKLPWATQALLLIYSGLAYLASDLLWTSGGGQAVLQVGAVLLFLVAVVNLASTPFLGRFGPQLRIPIMVLHGVVGVVGLMVVFVLPPLAIIPVLLLLIVSTAILCRIVGQASPKLRKLLVTTHVVFSVGWAGISAVMVSFALIALNSVDSETILTLYHAMEILDSHVIGSAMLGAIFTGALLSSATKWGYFKHWWVVAKIGITALVLVAAFGVLHSMILDALETAQQSVAGQVPARGASAAVVMAGFAFTTVSLITAAVISEYKPWGKTRHGQRDAERQAAARSARRRSARAGEHQDSGSAHAPGGEHGRA